MFTTFLTNVRPGGLILHSTPLYGGTNTMLHKVFGSLGYELGSFGPHASQAEIEEVIGDRRLAAVYLETRPTQPTTCSTSISRRIAAGERRPRSNALTIVDNTFLGPYAQRPLEHGADLVVYSATKYFGGHDDLVAGVVAGANDLIEPMKTMRYRIGTTADPHTAWLLGRSLETYAIRVERQTATAAGGPVPGRAPQGRRCAYLGLIDDDDARADLAKRQWSSAGAMISFDVVGGKPEAFRLLDSMELIANTTSLGGTQSIACHPWTTTHSMSTRRPSCGSGSPTQ